MIKRRIVRLLMLVGAFFFALGYGKDGLAARKKLKKENGVWYALFTMVFLAWCLYLFFFILSVSIRNMPSWDVWAGVFSISFFYAGWFCYARKDSQKLIEEANRPHVDAAPVKRKEYHTGDWCCPKCRMILDRDIAVCYKCRTRKQDATDFIV